MNSGENILLGGFQVTGASAGDQLFATMGFGGGLAVPGTGLGEIVLLEGWLVTGATPANQLVLTRGFGARSPLPANAPLAYVQDRSFLDTCDLYRLVNDVDPTTHARKPLRYVLAASGVRCLMADKPVDDEATSAGGIRVFSRRIAPILTIAKGQEIGSGWRVKRTTAGKPVEWFQVLGAPSFSPFPGRPGFGDVRCEMQPDPHPLPVT